ncbi:MAG: hypothetical protein JKY37_24245 [Nannocystaceae bacterium]|nr:hypothetical protein [Nannocystaceae bacterium]
MDNPAVGARAMWIPRTKVARVKPNDEPGVEVGMLALSNCSGPEDIDACLGKLPKQYAKWIEKQAAISLDRPAHKKTQAELVVRARAALERIEAGIELLKTDAEVRQAFCWANEAMHEVAFRRIGKGKPGFVPRWRLFQLAFISLLVSTSSASA